MFIDLTLLIEKTKKWCDSNHVKFINGGLLNKKETVEIFIDEELDDFLDLAKTAEVKYLIVQDDPFILESFISEKIEYYSLDNELIDKVSPQFEQAVQYEGKSKFVSITFLKDGFAHSIFETPEWLQDIELGLHETVQEIRNKSNVERMDKLKYSKAKQKKLAEEIAKNDNYLIHSTRPKLLDKMYRDAIKKLYPNEIDDEFFSIKRRTQPLVEQIFDDKYRSIVEEKLT